MHISFTPRGHRDGYGQLGCQRLVIYKLSGLGLSSGDSLNKYKVISVIPQVKLRAELFVQTTIDDNCVNIYLLHIFIMNPSEQYKYELKFLLLLTNVKSTLKTPLHYMSILPQRRWVLQIGSDFDPSENCKTYRSEIFNTRGLDHRLRDEEEAEFEPASAQEKLIF